MAESHNHHFVPQGYLRGFSSGTGRQARVFAVDLARRKAFETLVRNIGSSRDFNRIDVNEHDPNALERAYSQFEGQVVEGVKRISLAKSIADGRDLNLIVNLITLLAIRNPRMRKTFSGFLDRTYKIMGQLTVQTKERWDGVTRRMKKAGYKVDEDIPYEQMKKFIEAGEYDMVTSTTHHAQMELKQFSGLFPVISAREWTLLVAKSGAGDFITSDHPVCLLPTEQAMVGMPLGYGLRGTVILFPLCRDLFLVGNFGGQSGMTEVGAFEVAFHNARVIDCAQEQIYAADDSFPYLTADGDMWTGRRLLADPHYVNFKQSEDELPSIGRSRR
jgi:hypothetical protein